MATRFSQNSISPSWDSSSMRGLQWRPSQALLVLVCSFPRSADKHTLSFCCHPLPRRTHPIDWNDSTTKRWKLEPRKGERAVLRASISVPGRPHPLIVYCAHLEVFCGALARVRHLADIFEDARSQIDKVQKGVLLGI